MSRLLQTRHLLLPLLFLAALLIQLLYFLLPQQPVGLFILEPLVIIAVVLLLAGLALARRVSLASATFSLVIFLCVARILLDALSNSTAIYDDAYMFLRYARNLIDYGRIAWNPGGEAVYGLTSPAYLIVVTPLMLLLPGRDPLMIAPLASMIGGVLFLILLFYLLWRYLQVSTGIKQGIIAFIFFALAANSRVLSAHFVSGMDTSFAMAALTGYLIVAKWHEAQPSRRSMIVMALTGSLLYFVRPDLLLFTFLTPLISLVGGRSRQQRLQSIGILALNALVLGLALAACYFYFGTALPLPFYAKSGGLYSSPALLAHYQDVPTTMLLGFIITYGFLFVPLFVGFILGLRKWWRQSQSVDKAILLAGFGFIVYYLFFVLQIMPYNQRFYHPLLPAVAFISAQVIAIFLVQAFSRTITRFSPLMIVTLWVLLGILFFGPVIFQDHKLNIFQKARDGILIWQTGSAHTQTQTMWFGLADFSQLADDLVIAATEVGLPSVANYRQTVIDLAGLNEPAIIKNGFSVHALVNGYKPDLIYMPHPHYDDVNAAILADQDFADHYIYYDATQLDVALALAIRKDSPYYDALRAVPDSYDVTPTPLE